MFCNGVAPDHEHGFFIITAGNSGKAKHCLIPDEGVLKRCLRFGLILKLPHFASSCMMKHVCVSELEEIQASPCFPALGLVHFRAE